MKRVVYISVMSVALMSAAYGGHFMGQGQGQGQGQLQGQQQGQGQLQGQGQGQSQMSLSDAKSKSVSGAYSGASSNVNTGLHSDVGMSSVDDMQSTNSISTNSTSSYKEAASSAIAGPLVTSNNTCMGSSVAGGQGMTFGFSVGSTWVDEDCVRRLDAAFLAKMGDKATAKELMCQKEAVRSAYAAAGKPCAPAPVSKVEIDAPVGAVEPVNYDY